MSSYFAIPMTHLVLSSLIWCPLPLHAQLEPEIHPMDRFLTDILDFREPTGIRGTLRYIDQEKQSIWLDWEQLSRDQPLFEKNWNRVPSEWILSVYPLNQSQFYTLQQFPKGTRLELVIQLDQEGLRRILSFRDRSKSPQKAL